MSALPELAWFTVRNEADLDKLKPWVKRQKRTNTYSSRVDKTGAWVFMLGWDDKPDSDWGRFKGNHAAIRVLNVPVETAEPAIHRAIFGVEP